MLDKIILYSIRNKLVVGILTLGLIVWGTYSITRLPIDAVPDVTNNQVQIITTAPSQSATFGFDGSMTKYSFGLLVRYLMTVL